MLLFFKKPIAVNLSSGVLFVSFAIVSPGFLTVSSTAQTGQSSLNDRTWKPQGRAAEVDPFVGTAGAGNTFPGPTLPFGMVQVSPDTEDHGVGYHYGQNRIKGFSMTHMSGVGCANAGEVFVVPTTGPVSAEASQMDSPYSHSQESASAGFYQVQLSRWGINAELSATDRTGVLQFKFPAGQQENVLVPVAHTLNNTMAAYAHVVDDHTIEGYVVNQSFCGRKHYYKTYFAMNFSRPFSTFGTWSGTTPNSPAQLLTDSRSVTQDGPGQWVGAYVSWPAAKNPQPVMVQIGISYVDQAGAENNWKAEAAGKSFTQIQDEAQDAWNASLGDIEVSGGSVASERVFYTALYHSLLMPNILSDADGRYLGFDGEIHNLQRNHELYGNFSGWDIYRSQMPLLALIEPRRMQDMAQSIVLMYQQGGWIDRWPEINTYTNDMVGSPLTVVLSTAWLDGLRGFDMNAAWKGMYLDATQAPPPGKPYVGEEGIGWINTLHYIPNDKVHGSVSQLQEDAIAYASLYRVAKDLGKPAEAKFFYDRALYPRNLFNPEERFFHPRNTDGHWTRYFDPAQDNGFIEGSGWHYQWLDPADMAWLVNAVGPARFNHRLTQFFDYETPVSYGQYYNPYNEPDLEAPFAFNFSGEPWEAQRVVRRVLNENYKDIPDGIPGNDDAGEMSSWAVMSMAGFYSVDPASLAYELVSPMFPRIDIHLHSPYAGKEFIIKTTANPPDTPYIQGADLDGRKYSKNWIDYRAITRGGTLQFSLGNLPNRSWGAAREDAPPSLSAEHP